MTYHRYQRLNQTCPKCGNMARLLHQDAQGGELYVHAEVVQDTPIGDLRVSETCYVAPQGGLVLPGFANTENDPRPIVETQLEIDLVNEAEDSYCIECGGFPGDPDLELCSYHEEFLSEAEELLHRHAIEGKFKNRDLTPSIAERAREQYPDDKRINPPPPGEDITQETHPEIWESLQPPEETDSLEGFGDLEGFGRYGESQDLGDF